MNSSPYGLIQQDPNELLRMEEQRKKDMKQQEEMIKYYNEIYAKLSEIIKTNPGNNYIDPYNLISILQDGNAMIPREKMSLFFKHLLAYTYTAKASEIENYQAVNKHLQQIELQLKELLNKDKKQTEIAAAPPAVLST